MRFGKGPTAGSHLSFIMGSHRRLNANYHHHRRTRNQASGNRLNMHQTDDDDDDKNDDFSSIFTCSVEAHPYGVLPGGNRFLTRHNNKNNNNNNNNDNNSNNNNNICSSLDDEIWQDILSFCDGPTLSRVVQTCRRWYVMGHTPELWRDLVLRLQRDLDVMGPSWKDTYVQMMMMNNSNDDDDDNSNIKASPHQPLPMAGVYSDYLFRSHMCRSFSIPNHWLYVEPVEEDGAHPSLKSSSSSSSVPRVKALSPLDFLEHYEQQNRPVVIVGAAQSWPATQKWSDSKYFTALLQRQQQQQQQSMATTDSQHHTNHQTTTTTTFRATSGAAPLSAQFTWPAYLDYTKWDYLEEAPLYLFDRGAVVPQQLKIQDDAPVDSLATALQDDYLPSLRETLPFWDSTKCADNGGHDLFQYLGEGKRPDHTWLIVGPRRSGSVFHIDPNATHAWNASIVGRKRWIFYPPGVPPPGVYPSDDGDHVTLPLSIGEWLINYYETEHAAAMMRARANSSDPTFLRPCECTAEAGDVVFIPHGWWHMVVNLDDLNMAITHNYVSRSNLPNMIRFLRTQPDQISGCRDRPESIKPEHLHDAFCNALQIHHPDWLREAQAVNDWTCRAWKTITATPTAATTVRRRKRKTASGESCGQHDKQRKENAMSQNGRADADAVTVQPQESLLLIEQNGHNYTAVSEKCKNSVLMPNESASSGFRFSFL